MEINFPPIFLTQVCCGKFEKIFHLRKLFYAAVGVQWQYPSQLSRSYCSIAKQNGIFAFHTWLEMKICQRTKTSYIDKNYAGFCNLISIS